MKKCVLCSNAAIYSIKDTSEFYCEDCALENFADVGSLTRIGEKSEEEPSLAEQFEDVE